MITLSEREEIGLLHFLEKVDMNTWAVSQEAPFTQDDRLVCKRMKDVLRKRWDEFTAQVKR